MPTYRLDVEYQGTRFRGWQEQQNARSIAGALRHALTGAGADVMELGGSGRTDAGVHALAQTAHLRLRRAVDPRALQRETNDRLPPDVHVLSLVEADASFHARHGAVGRAYLYQIALRRTGFGKPWVWWVRDRLDLERMTRAAALFAERHDFARFCERPAEQESTIVVVDEVRLELHGCLLLARLTASHFLWKMVRRVVGTLVEVGRGNVDERGIERLLDGRETELGPAAWTAPPSGLFLERVLYPGEPPLAPLAPVLQVGADALGAARFSGPVPRRKQAARVQPRR